MGRRLSVPGKSSGLLELPGPGQRRRYRRPGLRLSARIGEPLNCRLSLLIMPCYG